MSTINYIKSVNAERNKKFLYATIFLLALSIGTLVWHPQEKPLEKDQSELIEE